MPARHEEWEVIVDGRAVGRELRTVLAPVAGPNGAELTTLSHTVTYMRLGRLQFETRLVRTEIVGAADGRLRFASHTAIDQVRVRSVAVADDEGRWLRRIEISSAAGEDPPAQPEPAGLSGDELGNFGLAGRMAAVAAGRIAPGRVRLYDPLLLAPVELDILPPEQDALSVDGRLRPVLRVRARLASNGEDSLVITFAEGGEPLIEDYPRIAERRMRSTAGLAGVEPGEVSVGLRSDTYLSPSSLPTRANYRITTDPERLPHLLALGEAHNQRLEQRSATELELVVGAGAPGGDLPPGPEDLAPSLYVTPTAKPIVAALRYLRSAGRSGSLSPARRANASTLIAELAQDRQLTRRLAEPEALASTVARFVSALIPEKHHTFTMVDAPTVLVEGAGDCTEHAVLFASLMRAAGVPTRLVAGLALQPGGLWAYHMWNEYWGGAVWQAIDVSALLHPPGALHIAIGIGQARFENMREDLARFIWRTFNGVAIDLVAAERNGETLRLARPVTAVGTLQELAVFAAVVRAERGDDRGALAVLDAEIPEESRSLGVRLMRAELLTRAGDAEPALQAIAQLRKETSAVENTRLLDRLELTALLALRRFDEARAMVNRIVASPHAEESEKVLARVDLFEATGEPGLAVALLEESLDREPRRSRLAARLAALLARDGGAALSEARRLAERAVRLDRAATPESLVVLARILSAEGRRYEARWLAAHALVLAPEDPDLLHLDEELGPPRISAAAATDRGSAPGNGR